MTGGLLSDETQAASGFVYVLASEKSAYLKIGLTTDVPHRRIRAINSDATYGPLGVWSLLDCRQVNDCRKIETLLHMAFAEQRVHKYPKARELFSISHDEARNALSALPHDQLKGIQPVSKLGMNLPVLNYLHTLFRSSGLENFFDSQGRWTFTLFPGTGLGNRYFTLNIGVHEVAFSGGDDRGEYHSLVLDQSVMSDEKALKWLYRHQADIENAGTRYKRARPNSVSVIVETSTDKMLGFLKMQGVRRSLLAYWYDYLLEMIDRDSRSLHIRSHNYTAVSELFRTMRAARSIEMSD